MKTVVEATVDLPAAEVPAGKTGGGGGVHDVRQKVSLAGARGAVEQQAPALADVVLDPGLDLTHLVQDGPLALVVDDVGVQSTAWGQVTARLQVQGQ